MIETKLMKTITNCVECGLPLTEKTIFNCTKCNKIEDKKHGKTKRS